MRFNFSALLSLAALTLAPVATAVVARAAQPLPRVQCPEAARFGSLQVVPSTLAPGDSFTVHVDLTCSAQLGYLPTYMDYYIEVLSNNNGHEAPILLARRTYNLSPTDPSPADTFTAELPPWYYFEGAQYSVVFQNSFAKSGPNNNSVITTGAISAAINITGI
ncbi:hypothetical protein B0H17DRAFT_1209518 [Mycena rosella]|uniref:Spore coat protein U domain-containing protein n=1 Tax=Mycena rosella TaxID=1033263 RepID=A0AAD7G601_MYCRO|nr:hypothetical protein B0H17DRAFT_1209518 [Mycena rosella]